MSSVGRFPTYEAEERLRATGVELVPLHGTPAPALPAHVVDAVASVLGRPMSTPPARGLVSLREALAVELEQTTGRSVDAGSELLVTNGAMQALGVCFRALLEPGDEVVVPAPCFFFEGPIRAAGGIPVYVPGLPQDGWRWDREAIGRAIGPRTRALLLCNPGNPTGYVPDRDDVAAVVRAAQQAGVLVVTDEAYEASLWDGAELASAFGLAADVIVIRSLGKSLSMPQLRVGLLAGPAARVEACARVLEWDCLRVGITAQVAALAALTGSRGWLADVQADMVAARAVALEVLDQAPELTAVTPRAAPFLFVGSTSGDPVADDLAAVGLPVVDGFQFQAPGYARLPFGGATEARPALERALARFVALRAA
ncbi:MAG: pyridoxal phosphate-dependent aminotransferase [Gaiella sp.]